MGEETEANPDGGSAPVEPSDGEAADEPADAAADEPADSGDGAAGEPAADSADAPDGEGDVDGGTDAPADADASTEASADADSGDGEPDAASNLTAVEDHEPEHADAVSGTADAEDASDTPDVEEATADADAVVADPAAVDAATPAAIDAATPAAADVEPVGDAAPIDDAETADATTADVATAEAADAVDAATADAGTGTITEETPVSPTGGEPVDGTDDADLWDSRRREPPDDEEMPLADHIEEMLRRLAVVVLVAGTVSLLLFPLAEVPIDFLWDSILPGGESTDPRVYGPLELMFARLKVASLGGLVVALPVFVYETYQFMRPGLYPHERRYYLAAVPTSLVLALVGIGFAFFFVLPALFIYFLEYTQGAATVAFSLKKTFDLILMTMGFLAIVFQIPLFIMLAIMMGLTSREWLAARRIYFWGGFLGVSFLFGIDPTGMAPIVIAATMVVLFEGTLLLLKWTDRG